MCENLCVCVFSHFSRAWLFVTPWTLAPRLLCPWDFPGKDTAVVCHFLLQRIHRRTIQRKVLMTWITTNECGHSPRARHPGVRSQAGLRKHHYEQSYWRWWNSSWPISNPGRWCCESAALNMPANLENPAVTTGLEKVSLHSNSKERQCQRMLKLSNTCTHLTC